MNPIVTRCGFGIGNRVTMLANALSRQDTVLFQWRVNPVLPLEHWQVFPDGIDGVEFVEAPKGFATRWEMGVPGESWEGAGDRDRANDAYGRVMAAMAGHAGDPPSVAIIARFWRFPDADPVALAELASRYADSVFLLTDSRRQGLTASLNSMGVAAVLPASAEMSGDLDRTPESTLAYLNDWKTASLARTIITHRQETSVAYPARAAGATIIHTN